MKLHFQVTSLDKHDYVLEFKDFKWKDIDEMIKYIEFRVTEDNTQTIRITRWNERNEKK